jgi:hypothetical protein
MNSWRMALSCAGLHDCFSELEMLIIRHQSEIRALRYSHHRSRNYELAFFSFRQSVTTPSEFAQASFLLTRLTVRLNRRGRSETRFHSARKANHSCLPSVGRRHASLRRSRCGISRK